mmetsp:Transcript_43863/g.81573  ORF Transcript_43863/g.81573 Transcript_43863/m.81573 type:complete len:132 (-) Transcript_43863:3049-3444(-)
MRINLWLLPNVDALKTLGVDEIIVYCVNDGAVMRAWAIDQKTEGSMMTFFGDPLGEFTEGCGMELTHPGPQSFGLVRRCKRWAMYIVNNIVEYVAVSEAENDPAGDEFPEATCAPAMIEAIRAVETNRKRQ